MNHVFCTDCGFKIEYSYSKPKFCSSCGSKCGGGILKKESKTSLKDESLAEDETSVDEVPNISRLAVDTESYGNNVFSFESLIGQDDKGPEVRNKGSRTLEDFINDKKR